MDNSTFVARGTKAMVEYTYCGKTTQTGTSVSMSAYLVYTNPADNTYAATPVEAGTVNLDYNIVDMTQRFTAVWTGLTQGRSYFVRIDGVGKKEGTGNFIFNVSGYSMRVMHFVAN
jgi:hypothetical protein